MVRQYCVIATLDGGDVIKCSRVAKRWLPVAQLPLLVKETMVADETMGCGQSSIGKACGGNALVAGVDVVPRGSSSGEVVCLL